MAHWVSVLLVSGISYTTSRWNMTYWLSEGYHVLPVSAGCQSVIIYHQQMEHYIPLVGYQVLPVSNDYQWDITYCLWVVPVRGISYIACQYCLSEGYHVLPVSNACQRDITYCLSVLTVSGISHTDCPRKIMYWLLEGYHVLPVSTDCQVEHHVLPVQGSSQITSPGYTPNHEPHPHIL